MKNNFLENGYCVIDNFLPNDVANDIETLFKEETEWEKINQVRENHYKHVFKMNSEYFPSSDEEYLARFSRSENLEKETKLIFDKKFRFPHFISPITHYAKNNRFTIVSFNRS